jgi:signal transduction histidine kinase
MVTQLASETALAGSDLAQIFTAPKAAVINVRWPVVVLCAYFLLYSNGGHLDPAMTHGFLLFYVLSNAALYLIDEKYFRSPSFYIPVVLFDTAIITAAITLSGEIGADFYLAFFLTILLCNICKDLRGWVTIAVLSPFLYSYFLFDRREVIDPSLYLRLPFPFVVALFYGYFGLLETYETSMKKEAALAAEHAEAKEKAEWSLERIRALREIGLAVAATLDLAKLLDVLLERVGALAHDTAAVVWLWHPKADALEPVAFRDTAAEAWQDYDWRGDGVISLAFAAKGPVWIKDLATHPGVKAQAFFRRQGCVSFLGIPLIAKGQVLGVLALHRRRHDEMVSDDVEFFALLGSQAAMAIHNAQLYEDLKKQAVELERANSVKTQFLSVMSHELRTPLNVIMGYAEILRDKIVGELNPEQERATGRIISQSQNLLEMVNSILQAALFESEEVILRKAQLDLRRFLDELQTTYKIPMGKEMVIEWSYAGDLPTIVTDERKLRQILHHLVNNAIKFTERGYVRVSARHLPAERIIEFQVEDTGIGIPKDLLPAIFEKFRQLDSSETREYSGTGLGLYLVQQFVDLLAATIEVESEPGRGSTFTFKLPI